jgi:hypothetical protein
MIQDKQQLCRLPLQDVSDSAVPIVVKRSPGRPRKVELRPSVRDLELHAAVALERDSFIEGDALVASLQRGDASIDVLRQLLVEIAREAAALEFQRMESEKRGRDSSQISSRRIDALKKLGDIEMKISELRASAPNYYSESFQQLFALWLQKLSLAADVLAPELRDLLFSQLATLCENWEEEAAGKVAP